MAAVTWHPDIPLAFRNEVVTGDARRLAGMLPDSAFALAFADPPYWVGFDYGHANDRQMERIDPEWLVRELCRVARVVCVTPGIANLWTYPPADWVLGWFKPAANNRSSLGGFNTWEPVLLYGKPEARFWNDAISLHAIANAYGPEMRHRCPKPLRLLEWLIEGLTSPGEAVLDPVAGSATTAIAAKRLGRAFTCFELDPETAALARERVRLTPEPLFVLDAPDPQTTFAEALG